MRKKHGVRAVQKPTVIANTGKKKIQCFCTVPVPEQLSVHLSKQRKSFDDFDERDHLLNLFT
jgi:hypothetical protein